MSFKSSFTVPAVAAISFYLVGGTTPAYADLGDQLFKLLPDDGAGVDWFGVSVAISGDTAIVGAPFHFDNGLDSGSAYLFDTTTGLQLFKLLPNDGAPDEWFGASVSVSDTTAIVGVVFDSDNGIGSGSAYLFDTATGLQLFKLLPKDGVELDQFGFSVAISGATAIVAALTDDDNGGQSGSAYLFDTTTGRQLAKLLPNDGAASDNFGRSVGISGNTAIIGAHRDDDNGSESGSAYLFDISDPANPTQIFQLLPNDGAAGDQFGASVAISGTIAIVGARFDDDNGTSSGSAYLFDITTGRQITKLLPDDGAPIDFFGSSVAITGATALVGAEDDDDNGNLSGSAYFFDALTGRQIAKILPNDGAETDLFGHAVAISGATAIVGAYWDDDNGTDSDSAYLFDASTCPWDLDGSGSVGGVSDLLLLLVSWGPCPPEADCPADFDSDGSVGATDLLALLANWGPCP